MLRYLSFLLLGLLFAACQPAAPIDSSDTPAEESSVIDSLRADLQHIYDSSGLPGFAVAIFDTEQVLY